MPATEEEGVKKKEFRPKTPIPEEPSEEHEQSPETQEEKAEASNEEKTLPKIEVTEDEKKKEGKPPDEPKKPLGPTKMGGKSKLTGEILTGWL